MEADRYERAVGCGLWAVGCGLWAAGCGWRVLPGHGVQCGDVESPKGLPNTSEAGEEARWESSIGGENGSLETYGKRGGAWLAVYTCCGCSSLASS